jgi:hypothetical protein
MQGVMPAMPILALLMPASRGLKRAEPLAGELVVALPLLGQMQRVQKNRGVEKRLVVVLLKRMISGGLAAVLALALSLPLGLPMAYADSANAADAREKPRPAGGQNPQSPRNPREAKRPYAKRGEGGEAQRSQRLSPEERRQLRRDIKDAGREIYPPNP